MLNILTASRWPFSIEVINFDLYANSGTPLPIGVL